MLPLGPIDWFRIFADLERHSYSVARVAAEISIPRTRLLGWKNIPGTQPKFSDGAALIELWSDLTGNPVDEAPRLNCQESDKHHNQ